MSQHLSPEGSQHITVFYEVLSSDPQGRDPAELQAVADTTVEALKKVGYAVEAVPTGARGFDLLYQIIPFIQSSMHIIATHKDDIDGALSTVKPIITFILEQRKQRTAGKAAADQGTIEFEVRFGEKEDVFRFSDTGDERTEHFQMVLDRLDRFAEHSRHARQQDQPRIVDAQKPTLTIREHVPPRPRRRK